VVDQVCYVTSLCRKVIDIAARIVRHGGRMVLNVTLETIGFKEPNHFYKEIKISWNKTKN